MYDFAAFFAEFRKRPGMYIFNSESFDAVCGLLRGCDFSSSCLEGFREFLIVKVGRGDNLIWEVLVLELAHPGYMESSDEWAKFRNDPHEIKVLFDLVEEFLEIRKGHEGLLHIFASYEKWRAAEKLRLASLYPKLTK